MRIYGFTFRADPSSIDEHGSVHVTLRSEDRKLPDAASNGHGFAAIWLAGDRVLATRIDGETGQALDEPALEIGTGTDVTIAAVDEDYLLAWINEDKLIERRLLSSAGTLGSEFGEPVPTYPSYWEVDEVDVLQLRLTSNGSRVLASWLEDPVVGTSEICGIRLDPTGAMVGTKNTFFAASFYDVVADWSPPEAMRSFVVSTSSSWNAEWVLYRSDTGIEIDPDETVEASGAQLVTDGTEIRLVGSKTDYSRVIHTLDVLDGSVSDPFEALPPGTEFSPRDAWFDDVGYNLLLTDDAWDVDVYDLFIRRYGSDLSRLDENLPPSGTPIVSELTDDYSDIALASNLSGRTLLINQKVDVPRIGLSLEGRFIDNDGEVAPASGTGGAPSAGGAPSSSSGGGPSGEAGSNMGGAPPGEGPATSGGASGDDEDNEADNEADDEDNEGDVVQGGSTSDPRQEPTEESSTEDASGEGGGCGCSTTGQQGRSPLVWLVAGFASLLAWRRRLAPIVRSEAD